MRRRSTGDATRATGSVRADELLPLRTLRERLGVGSKGLAQMRRAGLPVRRFGRGGYVLGADVLRFFDDLPPDGSNNN